ncbi:hypothetical protein ACFQ1E_01535 [Sphingomonas canadensis]|uniref:Uncharacterized protein n=1 Tax=Sphingomonas canadensis TaxID=1219257 RepID=A0ABW3H1J5_9SPHN|nr:hypothetical protein [Sphingomonas canadensis]MCW3835077.1 hypothetical protein [Sphingomonas canadensis]
MKAALKLAASGLCLAMLAMPTAAQARWESISAFPRDPNRNCDEPHERGAVLLASANRPLAIQPGFVGEIEIYGQGIDLSPSASMQRQGSARKIRTTLGAVNAARWCGSIGSIVVRIDVPFSATGTDTLIVGSERIPVVYRPAFAVTQQWASQTFAGRSTVPNAPPPRPVPAPPPPPPPPATITNDRSGGCVLNGPCPGGGTGGFIVTGPSGSTSSINGAATLPAGIGSCIEDIGGAIDLNGTTLTITLPRQRGNAAARTCLLRPVHINIGLFQPAVDLFVRQMSSVQFRSMANAYVPPRYPGISRLSGPAMDAEDRNFFSVSIPQTYLDSFVGERRITIRDSAGTLNGITLVLRTDPRNGIAMIAPIPATRTSTEIPVAFDLGEIAPAAVPVIWTLRALDGGSVTACFRAGTGRLNATGLTNRFTLPATDAEGCAARRFELRIAVERQAGAGGLFDAPYGQSIEFAGGTVTARTIRQPGTPIGF